MMHRRSRTPAGTGDDTTHDSTTQDIRTPNTPDLAPAMTSGATIGCAPHHDPMQHPERELYLVTTQRCRGQYP